MTSRPPACTAFRGSRRLASGSLLEVALAVRNALDREPDAAILVFDDATGQAVDFDLRGGPQDIARRLDERFGAPPAEVAEEPARRGRPKLGVIAREITLLPRHWDWLAAQPGGASVALRKLVEEARRTDAEPGRRRDAQQAAYRFMSAAAGNVAGFEEATRALFAGDAGGFAARTADWPADLGDYARTLAGPAFG